MLREVWRTFVRKHIVAEVPGEMAACLDCDAVQCLNGEYETLYHPLNSSCRAECRPNGRTSAAKHLVHHVIDIE